MRYILCTIIFQSNANAKKGGKVLKILESRPYYFSVVFTCFCYSNLSFHHKPSQTYLEVLISVNAHISLRSISVTHNVNYMTSTFIHSLCHVSRPLNMLVSVQTRGARKRRAKELMGRRRREFLTSDISYSFWVRGIHSLTFPSTSLSSADTDEVRSRGLD